MHGLQDGQPTSILHPSRNPTLPSRQMMQQRATKPSCSHPTCVMVLSSACTSGAGAAPRCSAVVHTYPLRRPAANSSCGKGGAVPYTG